MGADRSIGFGAGVALEVSDVRLVEDGGERRGALGSNVIAFETASEGCGMGMVREQAWQWALTGKRTLWGGGAPQLGDLRLLEDGGECSDALVSGAILIEAASEGQSRVNGR